MSPPQQPPAAKTADSPIIKGISKSSSTKDGEGMSSGEPDSNYWQSALWRRQNIKEWEDFISRERMKESSEEPKKSRFWREVLKKRQN
jgi:hypothetical protein